MPQKLHFCNEAFFFLQQEKIFTKNEIKIAAHCIPLFSPCLFLSFSLSTPQQNKKNNQDKLLAAQQENCEIGP
jgi:hypothetical protein